MKLQCLYYTSPIALPALPALLTGDVTSARMALKSFFDAMQKCEESFFDNALSNETTNELIPEAPAHY